MTGRAKEALQRGLGFGALARAVAASGITIDDGGAAGEFGASVGRPEAGKLDEGEEILLVAQQEATEANVDLIGDLASRTVLDLCDAGLSISANRPEGPRESQDYPTPKVLAGCHDNY